MVSDPERKQQVPCTPSLAVVLQVRDGAAPGAALGAGARAVRRHLVAPGRRPRAGRDARGVDPPPPRGQGRRPRARPPRAARDAQRPGRNPLRWELATAYLGLVPSDVDPALPADTRWHPVDELPALAFDHEQIVARRARAAARRSSPTRTSASRSRRRRFTISELRDLYRAALGYDLSATNLQRVLLRRKLLVPTGERREPGRAGGRPAAVYRFRVRTLEITDQFAVLRPPGG